MARYIWGIDSSQQANEELYQCVLKNFSYPNFWGRYLTTVEGASEGLTVDEIQFLKSKGIRLLPIYNNFREATGYSQGAVVARNAIFHARRLGIPEGTPLFANVERFFNVDEAWIRGWVDTIYPSGYFSGIYNDPTEGNFSSEYCKAININENVRNQLILWSAEPELNPTGLSKAPAFQPKAPGCPANVWGWQYGRDAQICPIDTNLITKKLFQMLMK